MRCEERFYEIYGKDPVDISFCPYRICPIGAHSDHNLGKITGLAIDKGIHIAYKPKMNGVIEMCSLQFPKRAQWHIREIGEKTGRLGRLSAGGYLGAEQSVSIDSRTQRRH